MTPMVRSELTRNVKLKIQNVFMHGRFCCDPLCFEASIILQASWIVKLLPDAVPRLALLLNGR